MTLAIIIYLLAALHIFIGEYVVDDSPNMLWYQAAIWAIGWLPFLAFVLIVSGFAWVRSKL